MKFNFSLLKNRGVLLSSLWKKRNTDYMDPMRDWTIGLFFATLVFVGGVIFITYNFYNQFEVPELTIDTNEQVVVYREKDVIFYAQMYDEKEGVFNELRKNTNVVVEIDTDQTDTLKTEQGLEDEPLVNQ